MSMILFHKPDIFRLSHNEIRNHHKYHRIPVSPSMQFNSTSFNTRKMGELSEDLQTPFIPEFNTPKTSGLQFNRLQPSDRECDRQSRIEFGQFVAREAQLDEEYWTAAWLRAESHWENRTNDRYSDSYKRKFADQEFNALKRRCSRNHVEKCTCIVAVKKEERKVKRTVLKSVVGTLDLSIRHLLRGETFPGEHGKAPFFCSINTTERNRYGYVANLCVAKLARRQGIASNMFHFAIESAKSKGVTQIFVHVDIDNTPAQELYRKMGFQCMSTPHLYEERNYLLYLNIQNLLH